MTLTIFLIAIFTTCHAPEHRTLYIQQEAGIQPFEMIWRAVCWVESENNPLAFNKKELAYYIFSHKFAEKRTKNQEPRLQNETRNAE